MLLLLPSSLPCSLKQSPSSEERIGGEMGKNVASRKRQAVVDREFEGFRSVPAFNW